LCPQPIPTLWPPNQKKEKKKEEKREKKKKRLDVCLIRGREEERKRGREEERKRGREEERKRGREEERKRGRMGTSEVKPPTDSPIGLALFPILAKLLSTRSPNPIWARYVVSHRFSCPRYVHLNIN
jgi:hypothetical protein